MPSSQQELTLVAFGDSITHGVGCFGVTEETAFRGRLQRGLAEAMDCPVRVRNAGVGGDITPNAIRRMDQDVLRHRPQLVTVMYGVNDAGYYRPDTNSFAETPRVTAAQFRECLDVIVCRLVDAGPQVVLLTPLPMNRHYWGATLRPYVENGLNYLVAANADAARDVARQRSVLLVDTYTYFDSHPETVDMVPDGIHPNPEGHQVIARLLLPVVLAAIVDRASS